MRYHRVVSARFIDRPNRFIAHVELNGQVETVHVKNTGRCRELLLPGSEVWLAAGENPGRKTRYDLVAVRKQGGLLVNIDSQAPNCVVKEWLQRQDFDEIRPETVYGASRVDFLMRRGEERFLLEVKGCTLERQGIGYFPDAPTSRGTKHFRKLICAAQEGYRAAAAFVIQMEGITEVLPNRETDPVFANTLEEAEAAGVQVLCLPCRVWPDGLEIAADAVWKH